MMSGNGDNHPSKLNSIPIREGNYRIKSATSIHSYEEIGEIERKIPQAQNTARPEFKANSIAGPNNEMTLVKLQREMSKYLRITVAGGIVSLVLVVALTAGLVWSLVFRCAYDGNGLTTNMPPSDRSLSLTHDLLDTSTAAPQSCHDQCNFTYGCEREQDPTACGKCRQGMVRVGFLEICVQSCQSLQASNSGDGLVQSSSLVDSLPFTCPRMILVDVASQGVGTTCRASSDPNDNTTCDNVLDEDIRSGWFSMSSGAREWIRLDFVQELIVIGLKITGTPAVVHQCKAFEVSFNGSIEERIEWDCVERLDSMQYTRYFLPKRAATITMKCLEACLYGNNESLGLSDFSVLTAQ